MVCISTTSANAAPLLPPMLAGFQHTLIHQHISCGICIGFNPGHLQTISQTLFAGKLLHACMQQLKPITSFKLAIGAYNEPEHSLQLLVGNLWYLALASFGAASAIYDGTKHCSAAVGNSQFLCHAWVYQVCDCYPLACRRLVCFFLALSAVPEIKPVQTGSTSLPVHSAPKHKCWRC